MTGSGDAGRHGLVEDGHNFERTDYEHDAIRRRSAPGEIETPLDDPRVLWPDTLSLAGDGYLYFTANQIERRGCFTTAVICDKSPTCFPRK